MHNNDTIDIIYINDNGHVQNTFEYYVKITEEKITIKPSI